MQLAGLVLFTHVPPGVRLPATGRFKCRSIDPLVFAHRVGRRILVADISPETAGGYVAIGTLAGFATDSATVTIENIHLLPREVPFQQPPLAAGGIDDIGDDLFAIVLSLAELLLEAQENTAAFEPAPTLETFLAELRTDQRGRCSFSDTRTYRGRAGIIRPLDQGGTWHISNFIFLDPEPALLFANLAWSVGPRLELLINAYAAGPSLAETVNRDGRLALSERAEHTINRDALAWHRAQFFQRLSA